MKRLSILLLGGAFLLGPLWGAAAANRSPVVEEILRRNTQAAGGPALQAVDTLRRSGTLVRHNNGRVEFAAPQTRVTVCRAIGTESAPDVPPFSILLFFRTIQGDKP